MIACDALRRGDDRRLALSRSTHSSYAMLYQHPTRRIDSWSIFFENGRIVEGQVAAIVGDHLRFGRGRASCDRVARFDPPSALFCGLNRPSSPRAPHRVLADQLSEVTKAGRCSPSSPQCLRAARPAPACEPLFTAPRRHAWPRSRRSFLPRAPWRRESEGRGLPDRESGTGPIFTSRSGSMRRPSASAFRPSRSGAAPTQSLRRKISFCIEGFLDDQQPVHVLARAHSSLPPCQSLNA